MYELGSTGGRAPADVGGEPPDHWLSGRTKFEITKIHIHIHTTWKLCVPAPPGVFEPDNYIARRVWLCTSSLIESKAFWEWPPTEQGSNEHLAHSARCPQGSARCETNVYGSSSDAQSAY
jgi:hypothetical protein